MNSIKSALADIQSAQALRRKIRMSRSKLDRYADTIRALKNEGASLEEIRIYLKSHHRLTVTRSTISKWWTKNG